MHQADRRVQDSRHLNKGILSRHGAHPGCIADRLPRTPICGGDLDAEIKPALRVARTLVPMMNAKAGHGDVLLVVLSACPASSSVQSEQNPLEMFSRRRGRLTS